MSQLIKIGIGGALGRMGHAIAAAVMADPALTIAARFDRPDATDEDLVSRDEAFAACDVIIDFTMPEPSVALAEAAAARGGPALVIGATGLSDAQLKAIAKAAERAPIVQTYNYSLGVNMLAGLVRQAAKALGPEYDIEIFEAHHRRKIDAPSGTALMLGEAAAEGRGVSLSNTQRRARDGITGARPEGEIGFSVMRGGGIVGEHSVSFVADDEILTLSHSARDRSLFARGAVAAAKWASDQPAGLYDMQDVLGFTARG